MNFVFGPFPAHCLTYFFTLQPQLDQAADGLGARNQAEGKPTSGTSTRPSPRTMKIESKWPRLKACIARHPTNTSAIDYPQSPTKLHAALDRQGDAEYFVPWRKGAKPKFDHRLIAKDQNISTDWLFDGDSRSYPRGGPRPAAAKTKASVYAFRIPGRTKHAIRERIRMFAASRELAPEDIKAAMSMKRRRRSHRKRTRQRIGLARKTAETVKEPGRGLRSAPQNL